MCLNAQAHLRPPAFEVADEPTATNGAWTPVGGGRPGADQLPLRLGELRGRVDLAPSPREAS